MSDSSFEKAREILGRAQEMRREEREDFIRRSCADDTDLYSEVHSLLRALDEAGDFLEDPPSQPEVAKSLWVGKKIGQYRIERILAAGGMGVVYLARQEQPERTVALKLLKPDLITATTLKRFEYEAQVLGRLQHPGIGQIFEAGAVATDHGSQPFLAMEYIDGVSLTQYAEVHRLSTGKRLDLFLPICDAVHHAHQRGIIHRDLKPANIMVDKSGQVKVLDFGIARATDSKTTLSTLLRTNVGQLLGTIPYMSSEQMAGRPDELDIRTDVYSLGVVLYELLTGDLPHDIRDKPIHEAIRIIQTEDPTPLSSRNRILRGDLDTIVRKALAKEKQRRYPSASEFAADLKRYLSHEPITARPASTFYQIGKFARRNKALVTGLTIAALTLVLGSAGTLVGMIRAERAFRAEAQLRATAQEAQREEQRLREEAETARRAESEHRRAEERARESAEIAREAAERAREAENLQRKRAERASTLANDEAEVARAVTDFLSTMLGAADPWDVSSSSTLPRETKVVEVLDQASSNLETGDLSEHPEVELALRKILGQTYNRLGVNQKAEPHLVRAVELARIRLTRRIAARSEESDPGKEIEEAPLQGDPYLEEFAAMRELSLLYRNLRRLPDGESLLREALQLCDALEGKHTRMSIQLTADLGDILIHQQRFKEVEPLILEAQEALLDRFPDALPTLLNLRNHLAAIAFRTRTPAHAESRYREVIELSLEIHGPDHPDTFVAMANLAFILHEQKKLAEAEAMYRQTLDGKLRILGEEHQSTAANLWNLGNLLLEDGRPAEAIEVLVRSREIYLRVLGETHGHTHGATRALRQALKAQARELSREGREEEAEALRERANELR